MNRSSPFRRRTSHAASLLALSLGYSLSWLGARAQAPSAPVAPTSTNAIVRPVAATPTAADSAAGATTNPVVRPVPTVLRPAMASPVRTITNATAAGTAGAAAVTAATAAPVAPRGRFGAPAGGPAAPGGALSAPVAAGGTTNAPAGGEGEDAEGGFTAEQAAELEEGDMVTLQLNNAPLDSVLDIYSGLVRRVLLRPPQLAGGPISLKIAELTREETIEAFNGVLALNGISVVPVGEKFMKVVPSQEVAQQGAQQTSKSADELSELGQFVTKMVRVTKVKPGDIAQAVQAFASTKVQNPVLVFDDQNFFILRDMAPNVKRMAELIKDLDVTPELDYKLEVIPIRYGKVDEIFETLNSVVTGSGGGGGGGGVAGTGGGRASGRASGFRSGGRGGGGGGAGGLGANGLNSNFGQNQVGQANRAGGMTSPGAARGNLSERLRAVTAGAMGGGGGGGGAQYNLLEGARIIPDMRSNSLLVYASKEEYAMLTNIVAKIDTLLAQVLIESIILEVTLERGKELGASMTQNPKQFGGWSTTGGSVNDASIATNLIGSAFPSGFSYFGQYKDQLSLAFTAIANDSNAKVLARPRIQTTHAQPANFAIGDTVPYPRSSSFGGGFGGGFGNPYTTYDEKEVLTQLSVTPYITPDGLVTLEVDQTIDQLGPTVKVGQDEVPTIRKREASAVLSVRDREPVILGGFITDRSTDSKSGVPWLKDLPLLGWAFRSSSSFKQRSELIVLIRPTILNTPQDASKLAILEQASLPNAVAAKRAFEAEQAIMAEKLRVVPDSTNSIPIEKKSRRGKRTKASD